MLRLTSPELDQIGEELRKEGSQFIVELQTCRPFPQPRNHPSKPFYHTSLTNPGDTLCNLFIILNEIRAECNAHYDVIRNQPKRIIIPNIIRMIHSNTGPISSSFMQSHILKRPVASLLKSQVNLLCCNR